MPKRTLPITDPYFESTEWVYYIERGGLIKIGKTQNLKKRMGELLPERVLAVEPGYTELETRRHRQFKHFNRRGINPATGRMEKEWFKPNAMLWALIYRLSRKYAVPELGYAKGQLANIEARPPLAEGAAERTTELPAVKLTPWERLRESRYYGRGVTAPWLPLLYAVGGIVTGILIRTDVISAYWAPVVLGAIILVTYGETKWQDKRAWEAKNTAFERLSRERV